MSLRRVRVIAAIRSRRPAAVALARLQQRRDVELVNLAGAARAVASAWQQKPALVIFEAADEPERPAAGAGAFDAIRALRADSASREVPVLVLVPPGRADLREQAFAAGASDVCFLAPGIPGFEEALLHLAGIPARRWLRRPAAIASRVSLRGPNGATREVDATALNLSGGGVQLRWSAASGDVPEKGAVLRVEIDRASGASEERPEAEGRGWGSGGEAPGNHDPAGRPKADQGRTSRPVGVSMFACVQGGTRAGDVCLTRLRFVGLSDDERARLEALVDELPGPGEAEPEATPLPPDDADETPAPPPFPAKRVAAAAMALLAIIALAAGANALRGRLARPLPEPSHATAP